MPSASGGTMAPSSRPPPVTAATSAVATAHGTQDCRTRAGAVRGRAAAGKGTTFSVYSGARRSNCVPKVRPVRRRHSGGGLRPMTMPVTLRAPANSSAVPTRSAPDRTSVSPPSCDASAIAARQLEGLAGRSTCRAIQGACSASDRRLAWRTTASPPASGPTRARMRSPAGQGPLMRLSRIQPRTSPSTFSAVRRSAISRRAARLPSLK